MNREIERLLTSWKHPVITSCDLATILDNGLNQRYSLIKRLLKKKSLIQLKKGIYLIQAPYNQSLSNLFSVAPLLFGPSYVSLESALSFHGWIPEAVYTTTSVCVKRKKTYETEIGVFIFEKVPQKNFYLGVERIADQEESVLIAHPWKALADLLYVRKHEFKTLNSLCEFFRIELDDMASSDITLLNELSEHYGSMKVRKMLKMILRELS